jgi:hypothetical protein
MCRYSAIKEHTEFQQTKLEAEPVDQPHAAKKSWLFLDPKGPGLKSKNVPGLERSRSQIENCLSPAYYLLRQFRFLLRFISHRAAPPEGPLLSSHMFPLLLPIHAFAFIISVVGDTRG